RGAPGGRRDHRQGPGPGPHPHRQQGGRPALERGLVAGGHGRLGARRQGPEEPFDLRRGHPLDHPGRGQDSGPPVAVAAADGLSGPAADHRLGGRSGQVAGAPVGRISLLAPRAHSWRQEQTLHFDRLRKSALARPAAFLALCVLAPLAIYAGYNAWLALDRRQANLTEQSVAGVQALVENIDRQIATGLEDAETLARSPALDPVAGHAPDLKVFEEV